MINDRKRVYICSPYRGDTEKNVTFARTMCRIAYIQGYEPICPHLYYTQFLNEEKPEERDYGLERGLELLRGCDKMWVCGKTISTGMKAEIIIANLAKIPISRVGVLLNE